MKPSVGTLHKNMKYIVTPMTNTKQVSLQIYVPVGSRDEANDISGLSHLLEHMIFQGSESYPDVKDIGVKVYECGGYFNAFTSQSETVYHIECGNSKKCIESICEIAADVLYRSLFSPDKLENEKKIVINELRELASDPRQLCSQRLQELMFKNTRLAADTGGTIQAIRSITPDILRNFVNAYYTKGIIVSLTGGVDRAHAVKLLKKHFSETPTYPCKKLDRIHNDVKRHLYPDHHKKASAKSKMIHSPDNSKHAFISCGYRGVPYKDISGYYTLCLISELLTGYMGATLYKVLRHKKGLIYHVDSYVAQYEDLGYLYIECSCENTLPQVRDTIETLSDYCKELHTRITIEEFESAKSHLLTGLDKDPENVHETGFETTLDMIHLGRILTYEEIRKTLQTITFQDILTCSQHIFEKGEYISVTSEKDPGPMKRQNTKQKNTKRQTTKRKNTKKDKHHKRGR